jgi:hypothetical protein
MVCRVKAFTALCATRFTEEGASTSESSEDAAPQSLYGEIEFRIAREAEDFAEASPRKAAVCRTAEDVVLEIDLLPASALE